MFVPCRAYRRSLTRQASIAYHPVWRRQYASLTLAELLREALGPEEDPYVVTRPRTNRGTDYRTKQLSSNTYAAMPSLIAGRRATTAAESPNLDRDLDSEPDTPRHFPRLKRGSPDQYIEDIDISEPAFPEAMGAPAVNPPAQSGMLGRGEQNIENGETRQVVSEVTQSDIANSIKQQDYLSAWNLFVTLLETFPPHEPLVTMSGQLKNILTVFGAAKLKAMSFEAGPLPSAPSTLQLWQSISAIDACFETNVLRHALFLINALGKLDFAQDTVAIEAVHLHYFSEVMDFLTKWLSAYTPQAFSAISIPAHAFIPSNHEIHAKDPEGWPLDQVLPEFIDLTALSADAYGPGVAGAGSLVDVAMYLVLMARDVLEALLYRGASDDLEKYRPFLDDMNTILGHSSWPKWSRTNIAKSLRKSGWSLDRIQSFVDNASAKMMTTRQAYVRDERFASSGSDLESLSERLMVSLGRFVERQNLDRVERTWDAMASRITDLKPEEKQLDQLMAIYGAFFTSFVDLRRSSQAIAVWNKMRECEALPPTKYWNKMLASFGHVSNLRGMEAFWSHMIQAGVEPNMVSWSIKIKVLFKFANYKRGFQELNQLTKLKEPERTKAGKAKAVGKPKYLLMANQEYEPTTTRAFLFVMNSAMSGALAAGTRHPDEVIGQILAWGRSQGVEPNMTTYNTLLTVLIHRRKRDQARKILQHMATKGLQPDDATFTILIGAAFKDGNLAIEDPEEQKAATVELLESFELEGLKSNERGYALLIDRLLKKYGNIGAVNAVLDHIEAKNLEISTQIYTILITHWFNCQPPNLDEVDRIWKRLTRRKNYVVDFVFFDRMIEGYAKHDQTLKMLYFLGRAADEGKKIGLVALSQVLRSLMRTGDRERAKVIVNDVRKGVRHARTGNKGWAGNQFWQVAENFGL